LRFHRAKAYGTARRYALVETVRLDKWLWAARFYKTRALATEAVLGGHVHLNGARVRPAKDVRVGDTVQIRIGTYQWTVVVRGLSERRGPAAAAQTLYEERPESVEARERQRLERRLAPPPLGADLAGRPTKRDRRRLESLRRARRRGGR
jgi:ribosome-associated heat shock protein Hsp15